MERLYAHRVTRALPILIVTVLAGLGRVSAQSDLDAFMARVLAERDRNWTKLQQFILEERETLQVTGPGGARLFGRQRDYQWFLREGIFVRSPLRADGVAIAEGERIDEENDWIRRERRRNRQEPRFVSAAYFLRFTFDPGQYALAGREPLEGRDVLRIEYYPTRMFNEGRLRPNRELRKRDDQIEEKLNKGSLVTLWIDPAAHQILQYEFDNVDMEFLPARFLMRMDAMRATMRMGQPFEGVWLPRSIAIRVEGTLATGAVNASYDVEYYDYRLAEVKAEIK